MENEIKGGIIQFSLGDYNIEVIVKENRLEDFIVTETVNRFDKIYFCHDNYEKQK